jgi:putative FmdB family regulatory protein
LFSPGKKECRMMALYEFRCEKCGEKAEKIMRMSEVVADLKCPKCGGKMKRQIGKISHWEWKEALA